MISKMADSGGAFEFRLLKNVPEFVCCKLATCGLDRWKGQVEVATEDDFRTNLWKSEV